ncbi:protein-L-isoaspartate O-methyltransferase [Spiribacter roseus]|uniref:protein-L-isoaspartate O-methyltransferase family protein n=1 Tax=Spiribacter roseus TaxID=1855875 RepID=UPI000F6CEC1D|nr:protein-L-isoaspartate O-methyltransferase [Spiribacter roseus]
MTDVNLATARDNMVEQQLRTWEILNERVLEVMHRMPRDRFTPSAFANLAYADMQVPIDHDQVMLEPKVVGRLLQALDPQPNERALEIGTGTGYLTACLGEMAADVTSVDLYPEFTELAASNLKKQAIENNRLETGDAALGWDDGRRYDVIAVTGSLPELHQGFHRSLTQGGRLCLIVGQPPIMEAVLITRVGEDQWARESLFDTSAPALVGAPVTRSFAV